MFTIALEEISRLIWKNQQPMVIFYTAPASKDFLDKAVGFLWLVRCNLGS